MNRLKELRNEKKLTQQNMADLLGMSRRGYQKIENGESGLKADKAEMLADYFWVSTPYLLGISNERVPDISKFLRQDELDEIHYGGKEELLKKIREAERKEKTEVTIGRLKELDDDDFHLISDLVGRLSDKI